MRHRMAEEHAVISYCGVAGPHSILAPDSKFLAGLLIIAGLISNRAEVVT